MGDLAAAKAFAVVILGGLGNIAGATVGGFILALVEELGAGYISSGYRDAMGFLLIIVILVFRPTGLFARQGAHRVKPRLTRVVAGVASCSIPLWMTDQYVLHILIVTGIFIVAAMSLNLLLGYAGQLSLGHVAFFGIGAYASALVSLGFSVQLAPGFVARPRRRSRSGAGCSRRSWSPVRSAGSSARSPSACAARTS